MNRAHVSIGATSILKELNDLVEEYSKKIVDYVKENDLDVRDSNSCVKDSLDVFFSEMIIRRAIDMRKKEKEAKTGNM